MTTASARAARMLPTVDPKNRAPNTQRPLAPPDSEPSGFIAVLCGPEPFDQLWMAHQAGYFALVAPEVDALAMEQDPIHRHKDVLAHSFAVTAKTSDRLTLRLAALFHDIGKPATREVIDGAVTFRGHEQLGAKITRHRLRTLGFDARVVSDVGHLVRLSGRFHGYRHGWTDAAVRRFARDAGHLLPDLLELARCDCTTRHQHKVRRLHAEIDDLADRIVDLARQERESSRRPLLNGDEVMEVLGVGPGAHIGAALAWLQATKPENRDVAVHALVTWWAVHHAGGLCKNGKVSPAGSQPHG